MDKGYQKKAINQVRIVIKEYQEQSDTLDITTLLLKRDLLTTWLCNLTEVVAERKMVYKLSKVKAEYMISFMKDDYIGNQNMGVGYADAKSISANKDLLEKEVEKEKEYVECYMLWKSAMMVDDAISQRISFLKKEYERVN